MNAALLEALFATEAPAHLGPARRPGVWSAGVASAQAATLCADARLTGRPAECLRALVLLWHDHLDEAHGLVQDLAGGDAAWVHGIMHRREPDYSNARYWFHRVGAHAACESLAEAAAPVLAAHPAPPHRLIREGRWDPFAFIDAVAARARGEAAIPEVDLLRELQRIETLVLARHLAEG